MHSIQVAVPGDRDMRPQGPQGRGREECNDFKRGGLELRSNKKGGSKGIGLPTLQGGPHTDMMNYVTSSTFVFKDIFQTYSKKDWKQFLA